MEKEPEEIKMKIVECLNEEVKLNRQENKQLFLENAVIREKLKKVNKLEEDLSHITGVTIGLERDNINISTRLTKHSNETKENYHELRKELKEEVGEVKKDISDLKSAIFGKLDAMTIDINKEKGVSEAVKPYRQAIILAIILGVGGYFATKFIQSVDNQGKVNVIETRKN